MRNVCFRFGSVFQNKAEILPNPPVDFDVEQTRRGSSAEFALKRRGNLLYSAEFRKLSFAKRGLYVFDSEGREMGVLIPAPKFRVRFEIALSNGQSFLINGWDRGMKIYCSSIEVGTLSLERMTTNRYSLSIIDGLDLPLFTLFSIGVVILIDELYA